MVVEHRADLAQQQVLAVEVAQVLLVVTVQVMLVVLEALVLHLQ